MAKQEIVISVPIGDNKTKSKALMVVVKFPGVISAKVDDGKVVVVGVGIDSVNLTTQLRKKMCGYADILSVGEVKEEKKKEENPEPPAIVYPSYCSSYAPYYVPQFYGQEMCNRNNSCSIM